MAMSKSNHEMPKCKANYGPLTPITYLVWAASVYGDRTSIIYGDIKFTWAQTLERCRRLACKISQLAAIGDTVRLNPAAMDLEEFSRVILDFGCWD